MALNWVCGSRMMTHSTRSKFTGLPPASPLGASVRDTYLVLRSYTATEPGLNSSALKMNGPEPICSLICSVPGVAAMRAGMMKGTFEEALPKASSTIAQGSLSTMRNVFASGVSSLSTNANNTPPMVSRLAQRLSEAATSSLVTGLPS